MDNTENRDTATSAYLANGNMWHKTLPSLQDWFQNVEAASGKTKQQNSRSAQDRLMMNIAVALRTCKT